MAHTPGDTDSMPALRALALAALTTLPPLPAAAAALDVTYSITLAGLPLGKAALHVEVPDGKRYDMRMEASLQGLAGALWGGQGSATSRGRIDGRRILPRSFALDAKYSGVPLTARMALDDGTMTKFEITPKPQERPDRVPPRPGDRKGVVDPVSALIVRQAGADAPIAGDCDRVLPVHDGTMRFDVALSEGVVGPSDIPAYQGPFVACKARYVPLSGHRPERWAVKNMQANENLRIWFAPIGRSGVMAPVRISVGTYLGTAVAEATAWTVVEDAPKP